MITVDINRLLTRNEACKKEPDICEAIQLLAEEIEQINDRLKEVENA